MNRNAVSADLDAVATAQAVQSQALSARESVEAAISRIEQRDPELSFMVADRFEEALEEADSIDRTLPLAGVPILVKDYYATVAGMPLTECSSFIGDWIPERDSEYVARLKRAGVIVLGSVTSAEFAMCSACEPHRYGPTQNPRALGKTTGGSSGGSASAVASGAVPVAHGSDAGGSIRMPSSCCGVVGLKPTRGRNPLGPEHGDLDSGIFCEHVLSRSVRDSAVFLDATSGPAPGDPYQAPPPWRPFQEAASGEPPKMRIGISTELPNGAALHPDSAAAVEYTANLLSELGHELEEGNPSFDLSRSEDDFFTLFSAGFAARIDMWSERMGREPAGQDLEPFSWLILEHGRSLSAAELVSAITRLQQSSREIARFYEDFDVWLSPTLGVPPYPLGYLEPGDDLSIDQVWERDALFGAFTWPVNMTGQPALSYPAFSTKDGVPIGIQLTGRFGDEDSLLGLAGALERRLGPVPVANPLSVGEVEDRCIR